MLDEEISYSKESEFDRAFPFIDELDSEIKDLKLQLEEICKKEKTLIFLKKYLIEKKRLMKLTNLLKLKDIIVK